MKLFNSMLLSAVVIASAGRVPIMEVYEPANHKRVYFDGRQYFEKSNSGLGKSINNYKTIREYLRLKPDFKVTQISYPDDIEGISYDIPYNYSAPIESSAKVLYSMLYQKWEIEKYIASAESIEIELQRDGINCRMIIYPNDLKVYQKSEL